VVNAAGEEMQQSDWNDPVAHCFGMLIDGRARPSGVRQRGTEATLLIAMNAYHDFVEFTLPVASGGGSWMMVLDTNVTEQAEAIRRGGGRSVWGDREVPGGLCLVARGRFSRSRSEIQCSEGSPRDDERLVLCPPGRSRRRNRRRRDIASSTPSNCVGKTIFISLEVEREHGGIIGPVDVSREVI